MLLISAIAAAAAADLSCLDTATPEIVVLTADPGGSVASAFGHTAVAVWDPRRGGRSVVYDFGRYRPRPPLELATKVLTMELPYYMKATSFKGFVASYTRRERSVVAQVLDLTSEEVAQVAGALQAQKADLEFAYHWYTANCTTKVRNLLDEVLNGELSAVHQHESQTSPADEVLRHSAPQLPLWFGLHWGSGVYARSPISSWDGMYLPDGFMKGLADTTLPSGRTLVSDTCTVVDSGKPRVLDAPPNRDGWLALVGLLVGGALAGLGAVSRRAGAFVIGLIGAGGTLFGAAAILIAYLGTFSPFWASHNLFFVNPLWGALPIASWMAWRRADDGRPVRIVGGLLAVAGLGFAVSLFSGFASRNLGLLALTAPTLAAAAWTLRPRP